MALNNLLHFHLQRLLKREFNLKLTKDKNKLIALAILIIIAIIIIIIALNGRGMRSSVIGDQVTSLPGYFDTLDTSTWKMTGWAYDPQAKDVPIKVKIYVDGPKGTGYLMGEYIADLTRNDLASSGIPVNHGFSIDVPERLRSNYHKFYIYARYADGSVTDQLNSSPKILGTKPNGDSQISALVEGSPLIIKTTDRLAGSIGSLTWKGKEFLNAYDHGRELQISTSFDFLGECYNPTEAGGLYDAKGPDSTSVLNYISASGNKLSTITSPAYWLKPNESYSINGKGCGGHDYYNSAQNKSLVSDYFFQKDVEIGFSGLEHVIKFTATEDAPRNHGFEGFSFSGYMPYEFNNFYTYNPLTLALNKVSSNYPANGQPDNFIPLISATDDGKFAMGVYSLPVPANGIDPASPRFRSYSWSSAVLPGTSSYGTNATTKWECNFQRGKGDGNGVPVPNSVPAGKHTYTCYVIVGTKDEVVSSMNDLYTFLNGLGDSLPDGVLESSSCAVSSGWACDSGDYAKSLEVNFYADGPAGSGTLIGSTIASVNRDTSVGNECGGVNAHGFNFSTPTLLKDGQIHKIYAYATDDSDSALTSRLTSSPKTIQCSGSAVTPTPTPIIAGCVKNKPTVTYAQTTLSGKRAQTVSYKITIVDNDTPECGTRKIDLDLTLASNMRNWSYSPEFIKMTPGQTKVVSLNVTSGRYAKYGNTSLPLSINAASGPTVFSTKLLIYNVIQ